MYSYFAYGLSIQSPLLLPELTAGARPEAGSGSDVTLQFGTVDPLPSQFDSAGFGFWATADAACHVLEKVGAFLVKGGREVVIDAAPGVEERLLRLSLLGPVLALILHQRGFLVLHGSVVARQGVAVACLGKNGWGKSTVAAALHAKGYELVTDDVAAIRFDETGPSVLPSFPQVKLWPQAASLLGEPPERLPVLHPNFDKRGWRAERGFSLVPRRLERIYALAAGSVPAIEPLEARDACFGLLAHWYGHRFSGDLLQAGGTAATHLRQCAMLAGRVPMRRLVRSGGSETLLRLADLIDDDLREMTAGTR